MSLIVSDAILRKYIPNVLVSVKGEIPLFEKLEPFLAIAEQWVKANVTSELVFDVIVRYSDDVVIKAYTAKVVVCEAYRNAIPSLDLVLTPNGFGVVSNSNVSPASKERVNRLLESLESERDGAIRLLLSELPNVPEWCSTAQAEFFCSTMFPNLDICDFLGIGKHLWQKYQEVRSAIIDIELHLTANFIGQEQMDFFRKEAMSPSSASLMVKTVLRSLRAFEVQMLKHKDSATAPCSCSPPTALVHIVDIIRSHPEEFPLWHNSTIRGLFEPPVYENKIKDKGYWF